MGDEVFSIMFYLLHMDWCKDDKENVLFNGQRLQLWGSMHCEVVPFLLRNDRAYAMYTNITLRLCKGRRHCRNRVKQLKILRFGYFTHQKQSSHNSHVLVLRQVNRNENRIFMIYSSYRLYHS